MVLKYRFLLLLMAAFTVASAQKYSNEFLSIGVGARSHGMGSAIVASVDDGTAALWNPAGLMRIDDDLQLNAMHAEWFGGVSKFDYASIIKNIRGGKARLGISYVRFGIDDIPNTLSLYNADGTVNYDNIVPFSAIDNAVFISYAQNVNIGEVKKAMGKKLLIGGNVKVIFRNIGTFANSYGFGLDLGVQYHSGNWELAAMGKDLTTTFNAWTFNFTEEEKETLDITGNEIPISSTELTNPQLLLGAAYKYRTKGGLGIRAELDLAVTTDGERNVLIAADPVSIEPLLGLEFDLKKKVALRLGARKVQQIENVDGSNAWTFEPSAGVGLQFKKIGIDYAFTSLSYGDDEQFYNHVVSARISFGKNKKKRAAVE